LRLLSIPAAALLVSGCARVWLPEGVERHFGETTTADVLRTSKVRNDPRWQAYLDTLGRRLASVSERPQYPYTFRIVESKEVNAFAVPDGSIFVTSGLLDYMGSDELALAGVVAHEVGHVARRHGAESLQNRLGFSTLLFLVFGLENTAGRGAAEFGGNLVDLGYGREMENEADLCAIRYLVALNVPPAQTVRFLEKLLPLGKDQPGSLTAYLRSHPPTQERIDYAKGYIARAFPPAR
jgi:beta-barrel assembly-enhancing protease